MRILGVVHVFYEDLWTQLEACLKNASRGNHLSLYVTGQNLSPQLKKHIERVFPETVFISVTNKGYDIYPFIKVINQVDLNNFDIVLKLHTKRDMHPYHVMKIFPAGGSTWRDHLLAFAATEKRWADSQKCLSDTRVGIVSDSLCIYNEKWDPAPQHYQQVKRLMSELGLRYRKNQRFVAGSIFAAKASVLKCLQNRFSETDFDFADTKHTEGLPHVLERVLGFATCAQGYRVESFDGKDFERTIFYKKIFNIFVKKRITTHRTFYHVFGIPVWYKKHAKPIPRLGKK